MPKPNEINGWSREDVEVLVRRTVKPVESVERFCRAVDKRLFLLLNERQRRATLHFHLGPPDAAQEADGSDAGAREAAP